MQKNHDKTEHKKKIQQHTNESLKTTTSFIKENENMENGF